MNGDVLVVDDQPANLQLVESILTPSGYTIRPALNAALALKAITEQSPDLILLDINMPGMNGIEAAKKIKELNKETRILMLTMIDNEKFIIDALSSGADGYLNKDADISELIKAIRKLAEG
ncbi:MAG: response regulator, partial [Methylococcales bacterium]|nr:response regulator [Methylococcales bacterium]